MYLDDLTIYEKIEMLKGAKSKETLGIDRLNIKPLIMADGSNGLRYEYEGVNPLDGVASAAPSTCFPSGVNLANTFNKDLMYEMGKLMGLEALNFGVSLLLAPSVNIKKNPRGGRNFEYFSEDPILTGVMSGNLIKGIEEYSHATIKHFCCNSNENNRYIGNSIVDEKALREIYLKGFELAFEIGNPKALMTSYNMVNSEFTSENKHLFDILRNEFKYDGLVMTDWGGINDRAKALKCGLDLAMPGCQIHSDNVLIDAYNKGLITDLEINDSVRRIVGLKRVEKKPYDFNLSKDTAYKLASESMVLLKNEDNILPLNKNEKYLIIGDLFEHIRYQATGSALINTFYLDDIKSNFKDINYEYVKGYDLEDEKINLKLEEECLNKAKEYKNVILFIGLDDYIEMEGHDRDNLSLPINQLSLINKLVDLDLNINVCLSTGCVVELPFLDKIKSLLYLGLPGEMIGKSLYDILFGNISPSGRLSETWINNKDIIYNDEITKPNTIYKESIFVGYRYYNYFKDKVVFPFGYGLEYGKVSYNDLKIELDNDNVVINLKLKNESNYDLNHSILVYSNLEKSNAIRPDYELKGFIKVYINKNEEKDVKILIPLKYLYIYENKWVLEDGNYNFKIGDNILSLYIKGEKIEKNEKAFNLYSNINNIDKISDDAYLDYAGQNKLYKAKFPYNMNTKIMDYKSLNGIIFKKIIKHVFYKKYKKSCKIKDYNLRTSKKKSDIFIYRLIDSNSLRSLYESSSGTMSYNMAKGILRIVNYRIFSGIYYLIKKEKKKSIKK